MTYQAKNHDIRLNLIDRVGSTEIASCIDLTYQEKQLSKVVLSYTIQRLPPVVLEVEYTPAVEFVRVRHVVTRFLSRQLRSMICENV